MQPDQEGYLPLSAAMVVSAIREHRLKAVDYAQAFLQRAEQWNGLNAFITLEREHFLDEARRIDERLEQGEEVGPLAGLPIIVKDCIDTADYPTTSGTPALRDYRPKRNAPVVQRLLEAGAIVAGKSNLHELEYGTTSNNYYTGAVHNPYNLAMIAGGSSGGTAAAIAAGIGVVGLGTDTGGSIRIPSALCGVAGLRPTHARWPQAGMMPAVHTRDAVGPIGRRVADLCLLDEVVTGERALPPTSLSGLRLGVPRTPCWTDLDPGVEAVATAALERLRKEGAVLIDVDLSEITAIDDKDGFTIVFFETPIDMQAYLLAGEAGITYEDMLAQIKSKPVLDVIPKTLAVSAEAYQEAMMGRARMQALYERLWREHDISGLVFPTTVMPARPIGDDDVTELNGRQVPTFPTYIRNTSPASVAGLPGLTIPAGLTAGGLPVGLEFDGPAWHDRRLLSIGLEAERVLGSIERPGQWVPGAVER